MLVVRSRTMQTTTSSRPELNRATKTVSKKINLPPLSTTRLYSRNKCQPRFRIIKITSSRICRRTRCSKFSKSFKRLRQSMGFRCNKPKKTSSTSKYKGIKRWHWRCATPTSSVTKSKPQTHPIGKLSISTNLTFFNLKWINQDLTSEMQWVKLTKPKLQYNNC